MKTDNPPGGRYRLAVGAREGYRSARCETEGTIPHSADIFHECTSVSPVPILRDLRRGSGDRANVTLGERPKRRGYALVARYQGYAERGSIGGTARRRHKYRALGQKPLGVTKGGRYGLKLEGQESFFAPDHVRPTGDSIYLAQQIDAKWKSHRLTPAALQKLVDEYGDRQVENKLRELYGFPPSDAIRSAFAYLETMLREGL